MGTLIYANILQFEVDDHMLDHLRFVVFTKLRKQEAFSVTVRQPLIETELASAALPTSATSTTSTALWISPEIALGFRIEQSGDSNELSEELIRDLMRMSYGRYGLMIDAA